ncbi:alcohol dehydrogenase catalytic domain-containing protein [Celeribacter halophilus]|uniref:alcohol dehydrogenase catalytic domain-containing protein n=1 Tax=Celeribacter halophilus TaxID=576117 RepID=UPI003A9255AD
MKAYVHNAVGGPDCLRLDEVASPICGPSDVVVENRAIGLNPVDWKFIEWGHEAWSWPHVPGVDGAGVIIEVGAEVRHLSVGMPVAYHNDLLRPGSFAERTAIPARAAIPLPVGLPFEVAAAIPCPGLTAAQALAKLPSRPGARILLTGASGAVGGALLQLAGSRGWIIHAVASASQHARVKALGAAVCHDYRDSDWRRELTVNGDSRPFWAVIDLVSGAHAASLASLIAANGHLVCIQDRQETAPLPAFTSTISLHEVGLNALHGFGTDRLWSELVAKGQSIADSCAQGAFDPQLIEVVTFEDLPAALQRLKDGPNPGNRVVML